jgi:(2Fe-2S) ferredoxin
MSVMEEFMIQLQQRNLYDKVAITNTGCLGPCGCGPNVLVYPEGIFYNNVNKDDVAEIFDQHLINGEPVTRLVAPADIWG